LIYAVSGPYAAMFVNLIYPGKSLKVSSGSPGKPWNLVFTSPGKSWKTVFYCLYEPCTNIVSFCLANLFLHSLSFMPSQHACLPLWYWAWAVHPSP